MPYAILVFFTENISTDISNQRLIVTYEILGKIMFPSIVSPPKNLYFDPVDPHAVLIHDI